MMQTQLPPIVSHQQFKKVLSAILNTETSADKFMYLSTSAAHLTITIFELATFICNYFNIEQLNQVYLSIGLEFESLVFIFRGCDNNNNNQAFCFKNESHVNFLGKLFVRIIQRTCKHFHDGEIQYLPTCTQCTKIRQNILALFNDNSEIDTVVGKLHSMQKYFDILENNICQVLTLEDALKTMCNKIFDIVSSSVLK